MAVPRHESVLEKLRVQVAAIEGAGRLSRTVLPFGVPAIDERLPNGGLALGALHEISPAGPELTHSAASGLFVAGILARLKGPVLWCLRSRDLFAPALSGVGLKPDRLLFTETHGSDASVLAVLEEGLRHRGVSGVIGEVAKLSMTAARRLQLTAETSGVVALVLRRWTGAAQADPTAALTRWRIAALPSAPLPVAGVGRARWRVELTRCRGGEPCSWDVEACDAKGRLGLSSDLADRSHPAQGPRRAAAR